MSFFYISFDSRKYFLEDSYTFQEILFYDHNSNLWWKKSQNTEKYTEENLKTGVNTIGILVNFLPEVEKDL